MGLGLKEGLVGIETVVCRGALTSREARPYELASR